MLHQCSLIRRAPFLQTTREGTQEGGLEINHGGLLMRGYLACVAREQYEKERSEVSSIHHSGNCVKTPAEQSFKTRYLMWAQVKKIKSSSQIAYNFLDPI